MHRVSRHAVLWLALALAMSGGRATAESPGDRAAAAAASAAAAVHRTVVGREIAFRALENAGAAYDDARQGMRVALQGGREQAIAAAKKSLKAAAGDYDRALTQVEDLVSLSRAVETAAADVTASVAEAGTNSIGRAAERAADRSAKLSRETTRTLAGFNSLVDALTAKWLVPLASTTVTVSPTTTTTTGQPLILTPLESQPKP